MDFEDFARQFRKRAAARLSEFEETLEKAQRDLEKSAEKAAAQACAEVEKKTPETNSDGTLGVRNRPLDYRTPVIPPRMPSENAGNRAPTAPEKQHAPAPRRAPGQVKSVLRRG